MRIQKTDIYVYADWVGMSEPKLIGILTAQQAKAKISFSFEYSSDWLQSKEQILIDPDISWFSGRQYPNGKNNFGVIFDSMPDTWGRTLMKRRAAQKEGKVQRNLYEIDYLLGVYDECRMGAIRFKTSIDGPFLDDNALNPTPPIDKIKEIQYAAQILESDEKKTEIKKWLAILVAPGSSLGGARPKANVIDDEGNLWIAKFPSKTDVIDKAAWEYLAYKLACKVGIPMAESRIKIVSGTHNTFFTKRFDRNKRERIHFASAMTMTGNNEDTIRDEPASYLDIADFIQFQCSQNKPQLQQLWKRIIFNIAISNTDDHLRNHGFILTNNGWKLSPAFDINPSIDKIGLALNIDSENNALDFELAKSVGEYFQLTNNEMDSIIDTVVKETAAWRTIAQEIGISKKEQDLMASAFNNTK